MAMNNQQLRIFNADIDCDIAVSAGAGTGKSTTLKNKVISLIKNRILMPSEFLIVTFTNDAASSLRNKIKQAVRADETLNDLITEVDSMHIDTLDSFRLFLCKKYANYLGIAGNINIIDSSIYTLEQSKTYEKILSKLIEEDNAILKEYCSTFITKNINELKPLVTLISDDLDISKYTKDEAIEKYTQEYLSDEYLDSQAAKYTDYLYKDIPFIVKEILSIIDNAPECVDKNGNPCVNPKVITFNYKIEKLRDAKTNDEIINGLIHLKNDDHTFSSGKDFEGYKIAKEMLEELKKVKIFEYGLIKNNDFRLIKKIIPFFIGVAYDLRTKMEEFKKIHGVYRFEDITKMSLLLLKNQNVVNEIKNTFKLVMIDEYQDNSDRDDELFTAIANNNLFVVGDIKQSIYGFKGANPDRFAAKYDSISKKNKEERNIDPYTMNINYRSRKEILDGVNDIFGKYMDLTYGGVDYKKDNHELEFPVDKTLSTIEPPNTKDVGIKTLESLEDQELVDKYNSLTGENKDVKFGTKNRYLLTCAFNIIQRMKNGGKVLRDNIYKDISFSDIAILTRGNIENPEDCREIFTNLGLPVNIVTDETITSNIMVVVLLSLIKMINIILNDERIENDETFLFKNESVFKQCYASVARSFIIEMSDQELYDNISNTTKNSDNKYIQNLKYRESNLYKNLEKFALNHKNSSLYNLVIDLFTNYEFLEKMSSLGNSISFLQKFNFLTEQIKNMDTIGYQISDLVYFFENIRKLDLKIEIRLGSDSPNAITIETIHKSKGLEYPIVYVECDKSFKNNTNKIRCGKGGTAYYGNKKYGYYLPRISDGSGNDTTGATFFISHLADFENLNRAISEETRLFYVALTRAQELAICVYHGEGKLSKSSSKDEVTSYRDIIDVTGATLDSDEYGFTDTVLQVQKNTCLPNVKMEIKDASIEYIKIENKRNRASIKLESDISDTLLKKGIRYHAYMQYVNFKTKDTSFIKNSKEREDIDNVLKNDLFSNLSDVKIYKEYKFYDNIQDITGVIDLLLVYKDKCLIVDYKLKNVDEEKYKDQLETYKIYISRVFKVPASAQLLPLIR